MCPNEPTLLMNIYRSTFCGGGGGVPLMSWCSSFVFLVTESFEMILSPTGGSSQHCNVRSMIVSMVLIFPKSATIRDSLMVVVVDGAVVTESDVRVSSAGCWSNVVGNSSCCVGTTQKWSVCTVKESWGIVVGVSLLWSIGAVGIVTISVREWLGIIVTFDVFVVASLSDDWMSCINACNPVSDRARNTALMTIGCVVGVAETVEVSPWECCWHKARAMARPKPREAPVTITFQVSVVLLVEAVVDVMIRRSISDITLAAVRRPWRMACVVVSTKNADAVVCCGVVVVGCSTGMRCRIVGSHCAPFCFGSCCWNSKFEYHIPSDVSGGRTENRNSRSTKRKRSYQSSPSPGQETRKDRMENVSFYYYDQQIYWADGLTQGCSV